MINPRAYKSILILICCSVLLCFSGRTGHCGHAEKQHKHVLLLNSYHQGMTWVEQITTAVVETLQPEQNRFILHIENMDTKRNPTIEYRDSLFDLYKQKYASTQFDLIFASDNNAYDFLRSYSKDLFGETPVVFCGVNDFMDEQIANLDNFTGVAEVFDAARTVEMALKNHPDTKEIFVINDYLTTGRAWERTIRQQLQKFSADVQLTYAENYSFDELEARIATLPPQTLVLLGVYFSDREGNYLTYEQVGKMLARQSKLPVYCLLEFNVGDGVVGGNVIDGFSQAQVMAEIGKRILQGENPAEIPVVKSGVNRNLFNYSEMIHFNINGMNLPDDSHFINQPSPVYEVSKQIAWTTILIIVCFVLLLVCLTTLLVKNERIKRRLKESESYNRTIFEESPIGLALCKFDGELLDVNSVYAGIVGYPTEELIGRSYMDFTPEAYDGLEAEKIQALKKNSRFGPFEKQYHNRKGELIPVRISCAMLDSDKGQYNLASVEDITKEKMEQSRAAQISHLASLGELAAGVAHEINNPINGVINYTQLYINKFNTSEAGEDLLTRVIKEGTRIAEIVKNLLHYSSQNNGEKENVSLLEVLVEALSLFNAQLKKEGIDLNVDVEENLPCVDGRFTDLERVIINLVSNSRYALNQKFGPGSAPEKAITIDMKVVEKDGLAFLRMSVVDSGAGIPGHIIKKIYNPFVTTKPAGIGTGLGLNICHKIIEDHNGTIDIESQEQEYTRVLIDLPVAK